MKSISPVALLQCVGIAVCASTVHAQSVDTSVTYKCPNRIYSNTMSAKEAKDKGCTVLDNAPISVIQSNRSRPVPSTSTGGGSPANRIDAADQRARDSDARRILESELQREEAQLATLKTDYNNGEPERQGNERNFQKYQERVADMKAAIARKESDIAALRREIGKQPQ